MKMNTFSENTELDLHFFCLPRQTLDKSRSNWSVTILTDLPWWSTLQKFRPVTAYSPKKSLSFVQFFWIIGVRVANYMQVTRASWAQSSISMQWGCCERRL